MGQAKKRGSQEQRIAEAKARERAMFPDSVKCNNCAADLTEIEVLDVRGIPGMRAAGHAFCAACNCGTYVLDGTDEGKAGVKAWLDQQMGAEAIKTGQELRPEH